MLDEIRASALQGFPDLVRELGGDPEALLEGCSIDPDLVGDPEPYVSYRAVTAVLQHAALALHCPDLGLRLSERQGLEILGPVALIARHATTVGAAASDVARYLHVYSSAIGIALDQPAPGATRFTFTIHAAGLPARSQIEELSVGVALRAFRLLAGPSFRPLRVALPHAPVSEPAAYRAFFDADVDFQQPWCGFDFDRGHLARPVASDDPLVRDLATRFLTADAAAAGVAATVTTMVARLLPTGQCSIDAIAAEIGVHERTLQRHLTAEGTRFQDIVDGVRREQARRCITETRMPMNQLAAMLGYSEQSSLTRACRGWFGTSPMALRAGGPAARPSRALSRHLVRAST